MTDREMRDEIASGFRQADASTLRQNVQYLLNEFEILRRTLTPEILDRAIARTGQYSDCVGVCLEKVKETLHD